MLLRLLTLPLLLLVCWVPVVAAAVAISAAAVAAGSTKSVLPLASCCPPRSPARSGLDNAGKTTIVKRISGEDASTVSPTLGFNINTLEFGGWVLGMIGAGRSQCWA